jgi:hypothetical protein
MTYFFRSCVILGGIILVSLFGQIAFAQTESVSLFENVKPVSFFDRAAVVLTFNKEKRVQRLQDVSKRYALSGVSVVASGNTAQGQKMLDRSAQSMRQALDTISKITDEQISDRLVSGIAFEITQQSELVQPLQDQEVASVRSTTHTLLEHNTRLLKTLADTSFDQGLQELAKGNTTQAERHLAMTESHTSRAFTVASKLQHENQKSLVDSLLDTTKNRTEKMSTLATDSGDVSVQTVLDRSLRNTVSTLNSFATEKIDTEKTKEESRISETSLDSAFSALRMVSELSRFARPVVQQEILTDAKQKQRERVLRLIPENPDEQIATRLRSNSVQEKILEKEIESLVQAQKIQLHDAIRRDSISADVLADSRESRMRVLEYTKKIPIEKEERLLEKALEPVKEISNLIIEKTERMSDTLRDSLLSSTLEFANTAVDQKFENIRSRAASGDRVESVDTSLSRIAADISLATEISLLIKDEVKKEEAIKNIKERSNNRKEELQKLAEEYKESNLGNVFVSAINQENMTQSNVASRVEQEKERLQQEKDQEQGAQTGSEIQEDIQSGVQPQPISVDGNVSSGQSVGQTAPSGGSQSPANRPVSGSGATVQPGSITPTTAASSVDTASACRISLAAVPHEQKPIAIGDTGVQFSEFEIQTDGTDGCSADIASLQIVVSGSVAPFVSRKQSYQCVQPANAPNTSYIPRIMYWWGKVNLHIDPATGGWKTDPDGSSGANLDKLTYCKKWYPQTTRVEEYAMEMSDAWRNAGNTGSNNIAISLNNIRLVDDRGGLSVGPIDTAQNRGVYTVSLPTPYRVTKNPARLKLSADVIGGKGLGIILWLSDIVAIQQGTQNKIPVDMQ